MTNVSLLRLLRQLLNFIFQLKTGFISKINSNMRMANHFIDQVILMSIGMEFGGRVLPTVVAVMVVV